VYSPVYFKGAPWVLLAEIGKVEVLENLRLWPAVLIALIAGAVTAAVSLIASNIFLANASRSSSGQAGE